MLLQGDTYQVLENIDAVYQRGQDLKKLYQDLITHFRNMLVIKLSDRAEHLVDLPHAEEAHLHNLAEAFSAATLNHVLNALFRDETAMRLSMQPRLALETILIRICELKPALPIDALIQKVDQLRRQIIETGGLNPPATAEKSAPAEPERSPQKASPPPASGLSVSPPASSAAMPQRPQPPFPPEGDAACERFWQALLTTLQENHPALAANLKAGRLLAVDEGRLEIELHGNDFNLKRVRRKDSLGAVQTACHTVSGHRTEIVIHGKKIDPADRREKKEREAQIRQQALSHPLVAETIDLFSGKVVDVKITTGDSKNKDI